MTSYRQHKLRGVDEVIYLDRALQDMEEARRYYEAQREGLGQEYIEAAKLSEQIILRAPFAQIISGKVRSRLMHRFPYRIFYTVDEVRQHIQVLAVIHTARDPGLWPGT